MPFDVTVIPEESQENVKLRKIIDLLKIGRQRVSLGWCQDTLAKPSFICYGMLSPQYCVVGAVMLVMLSPVFRETVFVFAEANGIARNTKLISDIVLRDTKDEAINEYAQRLQAEVEIWNDTLTRTQQQVVEAFDKAIALAESWMSPSERS